MRDLLLLKEPKDFDIATYATPEEVEKLFPSAIPLGKAFGVMKIPFPLTSKKGFYTIDVVTFRSEKGQVGHRYPKELSFDSPEEDVFRRDFTINALLLDMESKEILDLVGGMEDLKKKSIVCIGKARERFYEDALRMLRAFRFSAQLGFYLEARTQEAISKQVALLRNISGERIAYELDALLNAPLYS